MAMESRADVALRRLMEGNERYISSNPAHPRQGEERRKEVTKGQNPFAVIVGCSDSRIPPEIIFDQGLGDVFVIRMAGNVLDDMGMGSIEYAVDHLGVSLVVIMGHGKCGAVGATVQGIEAHGHIESIVRAIRPALDRARGIQGDLMDNTIRANVSLVAEQVTRSGPVLAKKVEEGGLRVVGAYYDIDTGKVDFM